MPMDSKFQECFLTVTGTYWFTVSTWQFFATAHPRQSAKLFAGNNTRALSLRTETPVPLNYTLYSVTGQEPGQSKAPYYETKDVITCGLIKANAHLRGIHDWWDDD
jgi:hypothetical protein